MLECNKRKRKTSDTKAKPAMQQVYDNYIDKDVAIYVMFFDIFVA